MDNSIPIIKYQGSVLDDAMTAVKKDAIKFIPYIVGQYKDFFTVRLGSKVDIFITKLVINKKFISYVDNTDAKILADTSKFEDVSKKYR